MNRSAERQLERLLTEGVKMHFLTWINRWAMGMLLLLEHGK